jgi:hypothetical protein
MCHELVLTQLRERVKDTSSNKRESNLIVNVFFFLRALRVLRVLRGDTAFSLPTLLDYGSPALFAVHCVFLRDLRALRGGLVCQLRCTRIKIHRGKFPFDRGPPRRRVPYIGWWPRTFAAPSV